MSENTIEIVLNGEKKQISTQTVSELLANENVKEQMVTVKLTRSGKDEILKPNNYSMNLENGDSIDLLFFMGGGSF